MLTGCEAIVQCVIALCVITLSTVLEHGSSCPHGLPNEHKKPHFQLSDAPIEADVFLELT